MGKLVPASAAEPSGHERELKRGETRLDGDDLVPHIELEVGGHLVVARAGGVQLACHGADQLGEPVLHVEVDILKFSRKFEIAGLHLG
jgi:hypothetical protein